MAAVAAGHWKPCFRAFCPEKVCTFSGGVAEIRSLFHDGTNTTEAIWLDQLSPMSRRFGSVTALSQKARVIMSMRKKEIGLKEGKKGGIAERQRLL